MQLSTNTSMHTCIAYCQHTNTNQNQDFLSTQITIFFFSVKTKITYLPGTLERAVFHQLRIVMKLHHLIYYCVGVLK